MLLLCLGHIPANLQAKKSFLTLLIAAYLLSIGVVMCCYTQLGFLPPFFSGFWLSQYHRNDGTCHN